MWFTLGFRNFEIWNFKFEWKKITIIRDTPEKISPMIRAKPLPFYLEKLVFLVVFFFFLQNLIYLVHLVHFLLFLWSLFQKESMLLWFWKDPGCIQRLIYLVIMSTFEFYLLVVKKCHCSCVFCNFSIFFFDLIYFEIFFFFGNVIHFDPLTVCVPFLSKFHQKHPFFICFVTVFWFLKDFQWKSSYFWTFQKMTF